jgi:hypothetical protein
MGLSTTAKMVVNGMNISCQWSEVVTPQVL